MSFIDSESIIKRIRRRFWLVDCLIDWYRRTPGILIGVTGPLLLRRPFTLRGIYLFCHKVISGKTGYGKSNFIALFVSALILLGKGVFLIDPHSDLARDILGFLRFCGFFKVSAFAKRLIYIDFGIKDASDKATYFLPLNILRQPFDKYKVARNFVEVVFRVWPYLRDSSPQLSNILLYTIIVLIDNDLPITEIEDVLTKKEYRETLLLSVTDDKVINFFHNRFDMWGKEGPKMVESTLNKIANIIFSPELRHSFEQSENALDFRTIIEEGQSVIVNLGGLDEETQQFIGCFLTIGMETAMSFRENITPSKRKPYFFVLDEFQMFVTNSEKSFNKFLSEARKYKVFLVMAHQYSAQLPLQLQAALQNTQRITFRLEDDSLDTAEKITSYEADRIKREVEDAEARKRSLPRDFTPLETFHEQASEIKNLYVGEAFIKLENRLEKVLVNKFPVDVSTDTEILEIEMYYAELLMISKEKLEAKRYAVNEKSGKAEMPLPQSITHRSANTQRYDSGSFENGELDIIPNDKAVNAEVLPTEIFKRERQGN